MTRRYAIGAVVAGCVALIATFGMKSSVLGKLATNNTVSLTKCSCPSCTSGDGNLCSGDCKCGSNCKCGKVCKCDANCTCSRECKCGPDSKCGNNCTCDKIVGKPTKSGACCHSKPAA